MRVETLDVSIWFWLAFLLFVAIMLAIDLGVFNRTPHTVTIKEAATWSAIWVSLAITFNLGIYFYAGSGPALEFLTGYLVEKSLAVDNVFVFMLILTAFAVPSVFQHRVLFWGIIGALLLRGVFIATGTYLVSNFHWILYIFGAFLLASGVKLFFDRDEKEIDPDGNFVIRSLRKVIPVESTFHGQRFLVRRSTGWVATPMFAVIALFVITDLVFAVDSIPTIFSITQDPFIVFTSNAFAILGLRAMFFLLIDVVGRFHYLRHGLSTILVFVGAKMLLVDIYKVPIGVSLVTIATIFMISIIVSIRFPMKQNKGTANLQEIASGRFPDS